MRRKRQDDEYGYGNGYNEDSSYQRFSGGYQSSSGVATHRTSTAPRDPAPPRQETQPGRPSMTGISSRDPPPSAPPPTRPDIYSASSSSSQRTPYPAPPDNASYASRMASSSSSSAPAAPSGGDPRVGSIRSNYYHEQRARMRAQEAEQAANGGESYWIVRVIREFFSYLVSGFSRVQGTDGHSSLVDEDEPDDPAPHLHLSDAVRHRMDLFRTYLSIRYEPTNSRHERVLCAFWTTCFPSAPLPPRTSAEWKLLGFQYVDPASDFRSAGINGLLSLHYFASHYPTQFQGVLSRNTADSSGFPFMLAALNCIMGLMNLLGWGIRAKQTRNVLAKKRFIELLFGRDNAHIGLKVRKWQSDIQGSIWSWEVEMRRRNGGGGGAMVDEDGDVEMVIEIGGDAPQEEFPEIVVGTLLNFGDDDDDDAMDIDPQPREVFAAEEDSSSDYDDDDFEEEFDVDDCDQEEEIGLMAYRELFCAIFRILDHEWHSAGATYFMFPQIMDRTQRVLEGLLELRFFTLDDVLYFNRNGMVADRQH